jgi:hypothetical protein
MLRQVQAAITTGRRMPGRNWLDEETARPEQAFDIRAASR